MTDSVTSPSRPHLAREALESHFGIAALEDVTSTRRQFGPHLQPDLQLALTEILKPHSPTVLGLHHEHPMLALSLSRLLTRTGQPLIELAPLEYRDIDIGEDKPFKAIGAAVWLFRADGAPLAVILSPFQEARSKFTQIEIVHTAGGTAFKDRLLERLVEAASTSTLYRGKTLSFESDSEFSGMRSDMLVHRPDRVAREAVVLDARTLDAIQQNVFEFDRVRDGLRRMGQSTRKGVLLYGPPGTGKTHTIKYITSNLPERTTVLITAEQVGNLTRYMALARSLQPSIVVLEDVDLIGRAREQGHSTSTESLLNRLLNEMDGLKPDADILFILTTNRLEAIEEALANRPGRVDAVIEIPLPDADCRRRLLELYGRSLTFEEDSVQTAVEGTQGASAAFMKEFVRRLAQRSLSAGRAGTISSEDAQAVVADTVTGSSRAMHRVSGFSSLPRSSC